MLDIAIERNTVTVLLDSPLDNLLGFEHAPRSAAERKQADALVSTLRAPTTLFRIDPAAACALTNVSLTSTALKLGTAESDADDDGHGDLDGVFEFTCTDALKATYIDSGLLDAFSRLQRIDVQVAAPGRQFKRELKRPSRRIVLSK